MKKNQLYTENWSEDCHFSITYEEHLCNEKSDYQKIDFYRSKTFGTFFTLDGMMMVTEKDEFIYHEMIVHPAFAVNPNIKNILVIGGGDGGTVREVLKYEHTEKIVMVEIDEMVFRLCQKYIPQTAKGVEENEKVQLIFDDGLKYVKNAPENSFDLILVDSTDPISVGEGLFSTEFYQNCYRILSENGILINQHESPYFEQYAKNMQHAHEKLKKIFPIAKVYQFHMPVYPSGNWLFGFASKVLSPVSDLKSEKWEKLQIETLYYNTKLHVGSFMLPTYVERKLSEK